MFIVEVYLVLSDSLISTDVKSHYRLVFYIKPVSHCQADMRSDMDTSIWKKVLNKKPRKCRQNSGIFDVNYDFMTLHDIDDFFWMMIPGTNIQRK